MSRRRRRPPASPPFLRRRSTRWLIGAVVLLAVAAILGAISRSGYGPQAADDATVTAVASPTAPRVDETPQPTPIVTLVTPPAMQADPSQMQFARVVDVIDGDTIDVEIDGAEERVRYYGIDTPERGDSCFTEATERNEELVGEVVFLLPDARNRDRNGRLLRYTFDADGNSIDAQLIAEGLARAWREDGAYKDDLIALEEQTAAAGAGCLWQ